MKTTVGLSDCPLQVARELAAREGVSDAATSSAFRLRRASYRGSGLQPAFTDTAWERIRDAVYRDRGA